MRPESVPANSGQPKACVIFGMLIGSMSPSNSSACRSLPASRTVNSRIASAPSKIGRRAGFSSANDAPCAAKSRRAAPPASP
jgi:hypothetical protein